MRRKAPRKRSTRLDREIAEVLSQRGRRQRGRRHHATISECVNWEPGAHIEPLTEAKRQSAATFERCYLVNLMQRAGSVSEAARLAGLDRTNFRRLLSRHGLRSK